MLEGDRIKDAGWFGFPELPALDFEFTPGDEFWALLPSFAILALMLGIKTISDGLVIQQGCRRLLRAIHLRKIQGMMTVNGVGMFPAGIAGTLPPMSNSSTVSL